MLTILSSSSSSRVGQAGETNMTSILIRAAGSSTSEMKEGLPNLLAVGGEAGEVFVSREESAWLRSA